MTGTGKNRISSFFNKRKYFTLLITIMTSAAVFAIVYGISAPRRYPLRIGERSKWDVSAPFDMEDRAQSEKFAEEAARAVPKSYLRDEALSGAIIEKAEAFIKIITRVHNDYRDTVMKSEPVLSGADLQSLRDDSVTKLCEQAIIYRVSISREEAGSIITDVTRAELDVFFNELLTKIKDVAENTDITTDNYNDSVTALWRSIQQTMYANQNLKNVASLFALSVFNVNVVADDKHTKLEQDRVRELNLERKIIIPKGRRILSVDDVVTANQYNLLYDYGLIESGELDVNRLIKVLFVLIGMAALFQFYLGSSGAELLESNSNVLQLGCIIAVVLAVCRFIYPVNPLMMPVYIAPILVAYFMGTRTALIFNIYILSVLSLFTGMDVKTLLFFIIGGSAGAIMMLNTTTRSRFTIVAFSLGITCFVLLVTLSDDILNPAGYYIDAVILFITCVGSTFLSMGLVALMENLFNAATPLRLTELSSGNTPLLRRLSFEAPGTHHHSLMVGYMAETAAFSIGANHFIAKTGAYYHDVGKLTAPSNFAENQYGVNPHDQFEPEESSRIIVSHTTAGVELCEKAKLPQRIIDIVREHHGDTAVAYFYNKAVKLRGEGAVSYDDFKYPGPRPSSREAALVMLADSCEAAVRSSVNKDEATITQWVQKIIRSKINDGQLDYCMISMRDIQMIEQCYIRVLTGYYHTRIQYPDDIRQPYILPPGANDQFPQAADTVNAAAENAAVENAVVENVTAENAAAAERA